jgi:hypothetical protein
MMTVDGCLSTSQLYVEILFIYQSCPKESGHMLRIVELASTLTLPITYLHLLSH